MVTRMRYETGMTVAPHGHEHEQAGYVITAATAKPPPAPSPTSARATAREQLERNAEEPTGLRVRRPDDAGPGRGSGRRGFSSDMSTLRGCRPGAGVWNSQRFGCHWGVLGGGVQSLVAESGRAAAQHLVDQLGSKYLSGRAQEACGTGQPRASVQVRLDLVDGIPSRIINANPKIRRMPCQTIPSGSSTRRVRAAQRVREHGPGVGGHGSV
jgi:hypothetical protein